MDRRRVTLFWCSCCRCLAGAAVVLLLRKRTRTRDFHGDVGRRRICPSVLSPKKGFPLCCEVHTCGTESPRRPSVRSSARFHYITYHLRPPPRIHMAYMKGKGKARHLAACVMIARTSIAAPRPPVFSSHSRQTIIFVERVGNSINGRSVNCFASGVSV